MNAPDFVELSFEVHNRPSPVRVWQYGRWYVDYAPNVPHPAELTYGLSDTLDPFGWVVFFATIEEACAYADFMDTEDEL